MKEAIKKPDPELEKLRAEVAEAAKSVKDHHYMWMLAAVREHFEKEVEKLEFAVLRHGHFQGEPHLQRGTEGVTRAEQYATNRRYLEENRNILRFLLALERLGDHMRSIKLAQELAAYFKNR